MTRYLLVAVAAAVGLTFATGCSLDDGSDAGDTQASPATTAAEEVDVEALRGEWAAEVNDACGSRAERLARDARDLPATIERRGFKAGGARLQTIADETVAEMRVAEPAPGDEARAAEMIDGYEEAWTLEARAVGAPYKKRDNRFASLMDQADAAREEADAIAAELGADECARKAPGPYANRNGFASVRWGMRASEICRARDDVFESLRSTDSAGFERADDRFFAEMKTLARPEPYAKRINRFMRDYGGHIAALKRNDVDESNRLRGSASSLLYDLGFELGYDRFCSARTVTQ